MSSLERPLSYRALFAVPGFARLVLSALLARISVQMYFIVLVLFAIERYHSPQVAGVTVMCATIPGLVLSPLAGALLDRGARIPLIQLDYGLAAVSLTLVVVLAMGGLMPPWALMLVVSVSSLTTPLSNAGTRSLFPLLVPRALWDRANAVDSGGWVVATVVGPGIAGVMVALAGSTYALLLPAAIMVAAAALLVHVTLPRVVAAPPGHVLRDAWDGLAYVVVRNRGLRGLAVTLSLYNIGNGAVTVALPVLVLTRLHGGSTEVGALFAVMGAAGIVAGTLTGRIDSEGRERGLMVVGCVGTVAALCVLAFAHSALLAAAGMALFGLANGPLDIGLFSLRQRVTDPAWFGRAFAVSMSLNFAGFPVGSAASGPVVARSVTAAFLLGAGFVALSLFGPLVMLRRRDATPAVVTREVAAGGRS